jgi:hypothetical protein
MMQVLYLMVLAATVLLAVAAAALLGPLCARRRRRIQDHQRYPEAVATRLGIRHFGPGAHRPWPPDEFSTPWYMHWALWY